MRIYRKKENHLILFLNFAHSITFEYSLSMTSIRSNGIGFNVDILRPINSENAPFLIKCNVMQKTRTDVLCNEQLQSSDFTVTQYLICAQLARRKKCLSVTFSPLQAYWTFFVSLENAERMKQEDL